LLHPVHENIHFFVIKRYQAVDRCTLKIWVLVPPYDVLDFPLRRNLIMVVVRLSLKR
jgi:hypothetical protein